MNSARSDLSLNWVIRDSSPKLAVHSMSQASRVCSGTWLCRNSVHAWGSSPHATRRAVSDTVRSRSAVGSWGSVRAWRSTTQNTASWVCWSCTQRRTAPRKFPRCRSPVGWMPEKERTMGGHRRCGPGIHHEADTAAYRGDRMHVVEGKRVSVRVELGGTRHFKNKKTKS